MSRARNFPSPDRENAAAPSAKPKRGRKRRAADVQQLLPLAEPAPADVESRPSHVSPGAPDAQPEKLWFCIHLPNLPLDATGPTTAARAVVEDRQGIHRVLLANTVAHDAGIVPGQSANAALALVPALELEERSTLLEQQELERLAAWLEQFSSCVSLADNDVLLLEIGGSLRLFGGLKRLRRRISSGLKQLGFTAARAIAPTPLAATWLARGGRRACVRAAGNIAPTLRSLPLAALGWPASVIESLTGMGVTRVGDCLRLPREGFARRFGAGRLLELDRALGRLPDPRTSWRAPERFSADYDLAEEQSDRELLLAVCRELLDAHERFLLTRQLGTRELEFNFYHLKSPATTVAVGCTQASRGAQGWFELLRMRFERVALPEPVIAMRLAGGRNEAIRPETRHFSFTSEEANGSYSMTQLAERLAARIGRQAIHGVMTVAEHRPQHAFRLHDLLAGGAPRGTLAAAELNPRRPLWMLPEPRPLEEEQGFPVHEGRLDIVDGPERIETGWWDDDGVARDYYTAVNPHGLRLWIFRERNPGAAWYLHGYFG